MGYEPVKISKRPPKVIDHEKEAAKLERDRVVANIEIRLKRETVESTHFPVDAFPQRIQNILDCFYQCYRLPIDYHATSILVAASSAIGNAYSAYYKRRQSYPPILYAAIVGFPSSGKSPAIDFGLSPLFELEKQYREEHQEKLAVWREECVRARMNNADEPPRPRSKDVIINNSTVESINETLQNNPKGLLLYQDELKAWINSMNSYRKGSDLEYYLSMWSGKSIKVTRTSKDIVYIPNPFLNVIGGIQPGVLKDMAEGGKADNGFLARILFAYPDEMDKPEETDIEPDQSVFDLYRDIIGFLHDLPNNIEPPETQHGFPKINRIHIPLSDKAKDRYVKFLNEYTQEFNEAESEELKGILGKLQQYCLRISLVIELLTLACEAQDKDKFDSWIDLDAEKMAKKEISLESIESAIKITEYFKRTALKVVKGLENPAQKLDQFTRIWYEELPEEFDISLAFEVGEQIMKKHKDAKLSKSSIKRIVNNDRHGLFKKIRRGIYQKQYL